MGCEFVCLNKVNDEFGYHSLLEQALKWACGCWQRPKDVPLCGCTMAKPVA